jgi:hypothetical protein
MTKHYQYESMSWTICGAPGPATNLPGLVSCVPCLLALKESVENQIYWVARKVPPRPDAADQAAEAIARARETVGGEIGQGK